MKTGSVRRGNSYYGQYACAVPLQTLSIPIPLSSKVVERLNRCNYKGRNAQLSSLPSRCTSMSQKSKKNRNPKKFTTLSISTPIFSLVSILYPKTTHLRVHRLIPQTFKTFSNKFFFVLCNYHNAAEPTIQFLSSLHAPLTIQIIKNINSERFKDDPGG